MSCLILDYASREECNVFADHFFANEATELRSEVASEAEL